MSVSKEDILVTREDQQRINSFAKWNERLQDYNSKLELNKKRMQDIEDVADELIVFGDDEKHPYLIGEAYFHMSADEITTKLDEEKSSIKKKLYDLEENIKEAKSQMGVLKTQLYNKFQDNIKLE